MWCADGIHLAKVEEDVVVLDVSSDQYDCLLGIGPWVKVRPDGGLIISDEILSRDLIAEGLASSDAPSDGRRALIVATSQMLDWPQTSLVETVRAGLTLWSAAREFRGRPLARLLRPAAPECPPTGGAPYPSAGVLVAAAMRALPWTPDEGQCLKRAFQLRRWLHRHDVGTDWVFGVRTWPFAAHCWLQIGDQVIADSLERVRRYTPIMAV